MKMKVGDRVKIHISDEWLFAYDVVDNKVGIIKEIKSSAANKKETDNTYVVLLDENFILFDNRTNQFECFYDELEVIQDGND